MGGLAFCISMIWAQAFPFVALLFYEEGDTISKDAITMILICSFSSWLLLNIVFFCTIDLTYSGTFFGKKTAPQYTCEYFQTSTEDFQRWDAVFENRISYTKAIHEEVKQWIANSITQWMNEKPAWFKIEMIADKLLPQDVLSAEGGTNRVRESNWTSLDRLVRATFGGGRGSTIGGSTGGGQDVGAISADLRRELGVVNNNNTTRVYPVDDVN